MIQPIVKAEPDGGTDWTLRAIIALLVIVAGWLLALPLSSHVRRVAMDRYHLQSGSFVGWAIQAPVPAMYNFYNRYRLEPQPWDATPLSRPVSGTINHFPLRLYTFGDTRARLLDDPNFRMLTLRSDYRGDSIATRWVVNETADGGFELRDELLGRLIDGEPLP